MRIAETGAARAYSSAAAAAGQQATTQQRPLPSLTDTRRRSLPLSVGLVPLCQTLTATAADVAVVLPFRLASTAALASHRVKHTATAQPIAKHRQTAARVARTQTAQTQAAAAAAASGNRIHVAQRPQRARTRTQPRRAQGRRRRRRRRREEGAGRTATGGDAEECSHQPESASSGGGSSAC